METDSKISLGVNLTFLEILPAFNAQDFAKKLSYLLTKNLEVATEVFDNFSRFFLLNSSCGNFL